jgi:hypothetical protein
MVTKEPVNYGHKLPKSTAGALTDDKSQRHPQVDAIPTAPNKRTANPPRTHLGVIHLAGGIVVAIRPVTPKRATATATNITPAPRTERSPPQDSRKELTTRSALTTDQLSLLNNLVILIQERNIERCVNSSSQHSALPLWQSSPYP